VIVAVGRSASSSAGLPCSPRALAALTALIALPFLCVTALRVLALRQALARPADQDASGGQRVHASPIVPAGLYRAGAGLPRGECAPGLIQRCGARHPPAKLEIFLVLEAIDTETQAAVAKLALRATSASLIVPEGGPQTKPKALNYGAQFARGDFVVVYDAEDRPQPGQLRRAWDVFRQSPPGLACLQAQLKIYNPRQSGSPPSSPSIFRAVRRDPPRSRSCGLPVRWAAHRNHFPRATLVDIGAWDPFNVTETPTSACARAPGAIRRGAGIDDVGRARRSPRLADAAHPLAQGLDADLPGAYRVSCGASTASSACGRRSAFHALMRAHSLCPVHPFLRVLAYHWLSGNLLAPSETAAGAVM